MGQRCPLSLLFQYSAWILRQSNERKDIQIGKEEVKLSLFADNMTLHFKIPKDFTRKPLDLVYFQR
jgi:hypothetical protein